ncbi:eukaryotic translation initiation factor 4E-binding protein [Anastrepha obliqua]|uniref:eukaryotic translation initiation factor 4E-binding protein n=1 Tax=Anastrepha ludens TaxID=28586 RepID=UPI0023AE894C|nr:eukaryotic translation initiation factor 4E-binding protein [Anastrepha ludens]XP_054743795.1 eukaryotic translation initiation factor 4E-binding protein [Anastrepha obliqua]
MSASPTARQAFTHALPKTKKIVISDPIQMPEVYSSTPGGTLFSTTPGGTKLIYERSFLKDLRGSPLSRTPPANLPTCLLRGTPRTPFRKCVPLPVELVKKTQSLKIEDQEQFQLEL